MTEREKYQLIVDVWRFWQSHGSAQEADEWWQQLIRDGEMFVENHHDHDAAKELITAILKIIEGEYKCQTRQLKPMPGS